MKPTILLLALTALAFSSCTTAYKTGQTPDDVYFSPAQPQDEYVQTKRNDDRRYDGNDEYYDDRYLRMKVHNRTQWSNLNDWYYFGDRYSYSYYNGFNNPWNPNMYWNYYYNPYSSYYPYGGGGSVYILNPKSTASIYNRPRTFNLNTFNGNNIITGNSYTVPRGSKSSGSDYYYYNTQPRNSNNSRNSNNNNGSFLRNVFSNERSSSNNSNSSNNSSNSSSSSSSSGSSSGSSAPVRRF